MKKGLLALVMLIVFAASVYAYAPVLSNIPDVIVGDAEDGDANNFFRFSDAFMFDTNVADQDDADADLMWSFVKTSGTGEITINGIGEETGSTINPASDLRDVAEGASIRDIQASPLSQDPGPYTGTLSDVFVALHVSDGTAEDSYELRVTSVDGVLDGTSGIEPEVNESFDTNAPGTSGGSYWQQFDGSFVDPGTTYGEYDGTNGRLVIKLPSTTFSGWYQWIKWNADKTGTEDTVTYTADKLVVIKASISASKADLNPGIRMRVGAQDFAWTSKMSVASHSGGGASGPTQTAQDFLSVFKPQGSTANAYLAFDCWATVQTGEIYVEDIKVYKIDEPALSAELSITDFQAAGFVAAGSDTGKVTVGDDISIAPTNSWATAANFVQLTNGAPLGKLLKATYAVGSTGTGDINGFRMRLNDPANDSSSSMFRIDEASSAIDFTSTAQDLVVYHVVANATGTGVNNLAVWTDSITAGGTATTVIESVTVESGDLPVLN